MIDLIVAVFSVTCWLFLFACVAIPDLGRWAYAKFLFYKTCAQERLETLQKDNPFIFRW